jgi:carboxylesterase
MRGRLRDITSPVLLMHSLEDTFVPPENMEAIFSSIPEGEKQMLPIRHSNHVLTLDASRQQVFEAAAEFVARVTR